jgi:two-component system repressor protein LuxO
LKNKNKQSVAKPNRQAVSGEETSGIQPFWITEKQTIERAIALCDGNIPKAASLLEVSASTVYRKLQTWQAAKVAGLSGSVIRHSELFCALCSQSSFCLC